jgi:hypothetical protein
MHNSTWKLSHFFFKPIIERNAFHYEGCDDLTPNAARTLKKNCGDKERLLFLQANHRKERLSLRRL